MDYVHIPPPPQANIIQWDLGGRVDYYKAASEHYQRSGQWVMIAGRCTSACTLALGLPNVCVWPEAVLGFHYPYQADNSSDPYLRYSSNQAKLQEWTSWFWYQYPPQLRTRLGGLTTYFRYARGSTLIRWGIVQQCPGRNPATSRTRAYNAYFNIGARFIK
jgi:hypothetical protein